MKLRILAAILDFRHIGFSYITYLWFWLTDRPISVVNSCSTPVKTYILIYYTPKLIHICTCDPQNGGFWRPSWISAILDFHILRLFPHSDPRIQKKSKRYHLHPLLITFGRSIQQNTDILVDIRGGETSGGTYGGVRGVGSRKNFAYMIFTPVPIF